MFYDRKIRYFAYYEAGERVRGSGFAKLEIRDRHLRLELAIRGLESMDGSFPVLLVQSGREISLGELSLHEGRGNLRHECQMELPYEELTAIRIPLAREKELLCTLEESRTAQRGESPEKEREGAQVTEARAAQHTESPGKEREGAQVTEARAVQRTESPGKEWAAAHSAAGGDSLSVIRLQEDKWSQLCAIYPHIFPFRDERDYLSITPSDFVLFPSEDYAAVHNSFLLHGYYNYQHLVLTRIERRGEVLYYLGVPGKYYEREKQVAVMFHFESFECAEEPAQQGDFGYYMMRVRL